MEAPTMFRHLLIAIALVLSQSMIVTADDPRTGNCTILNTTDHPIVIGIYRPSDDGISERLVRVAPKTQVENIPLQLVDDSQFVIAYEASLSDGTISRSKPVAIVGHTLLKYIKKKNSDSELPDVLIQYYGNPSNHRLRPGPFNNALSVPDTESVAQRVLRDANHSSQLIETPLAQQDYKETAEP